MPRDPLEMECPACQRRIRRAWPSSSWAHDGLEAAQDCQGKRKAFGHPLSLDAYVAMVLRTVQA